ncbi:TetR/AcrR family transcriptional regulator [Streptomyces sp. cg35]|uniref:TetR/AcrR family transcriptional regulator n=1 Tax=Streptomyces sp. cg35 TaxID=3421650 RepID=UPI003D175FB6
MKRNTTSRARLLAAAEGVFYERGIVSTNVDAVAQEAGVTKPTLYAHFPSKSALAAEALRSRHARRAADLETYLSTEASGEPRLLAVFTWLADWYEGHGKRGCAFVNAAAELSPSDELVSVAAREEKQWLLNTLGRLCEEAGAGSPEVLASQLLLLIDGVAGRVVVRGPGAAAGAVDDAARAAAVLVAAATGAHA